MFHGAPRNCQSFPQTKEDHIWFTEGSAYKGTERRNQEWARWVFCLLPQPCEAMRQPGLAFSASGHLNLKGSNQMEALNFEVLSVCYKISGLLHTSYGFRLSDSHHSDKTWIPLLLCWVYFSLAFISSMVGANHCLCAASRNWPGQGWDLPQADRPEWGNCLQPLFPRCDTCYSGWRHGLWPSFPASQTGQVTPGIATGEGILAEFLYCSTADLEDYWLQPLHPGEVGAFLTSACGGKFYVEIHFLFWEWTQERELNSSVLFNFLTLLLWIEWLPSEAVIAPCCTFDSWQVSGCVRHFKAAITTSEWSDGPVSNGECSPGTEGWISGRRFQHSL